ncbi:MAG: small multi-drug export protein [bacterium]|nr:small multi-drug export protein [bacterium]
MLGQFVHYLKNFHLSGELITLLVSMMPIFELRGGIPLGVLQFKIPLMKAFLISFLGNILPILPIMYFLDPIRKLLSRIPLFKKFFGWLYARAYKKGEEVMKYGAIGLAIFVAIPLPITGAWTGALIALIFSVKRRYAFPSIILGVLGAGIIVSAFTALFNRFL